MRVVPKEKRREERRRKCDQSSLDSGRRKKRVRHTHVRTLQFPESFDKWPAGPFKRGLITLSARAVLRSIFNGADTLLCKFASLFY